MISREEPVDSEDKAALAAMTNAERGVKEFILVKYGFLDARAVRGRHQRRSLGGGRWYDGYSDDMARPLVIVSVYGNYGTLSSLVVQVNGSPPKGTLFAQVGVGSPRPGPAGVTVDWVGFQGGARGYFTVFDRSRDTEPRRGQDVADLLERLFAERGIPLHSFERAI